MVTRKLLLVAATLVAASALAQTPLGTVTQVNGVATATFGTTGSIVAPGTVIQNGMRFVTTSSASITLRLHRGCQLTVPPGHGVTVVSSLTCQQLAASMQPVIPMASQAGPGASPAVVGGVIAGSAALIAAGIIGDVIEDDDEALSAH
jgi:hypothetical protein